MKYMNTNRVQGHLIFLRWTWILHVRHGMKVSTSKSILNDWYYLYHNILTNFVYLVNTHLQLILFNDYPTGIFFIQIRIFIKFLNFLFFNTILNMVFKNQSGRTPKNGVNSENGEWHWHALQFSQLPFCGQYKYM